MEIVSLSKDSEHRFSKATCNSVKFLKGLGVEGDAHCGKTVKHRSRVKVDPTQRIGSPGAALQSALCVGVRR